MSPLLCLCWMPQVVSEDSSLCQIETWTCPSSVWTQKCPVYNSLVCYSLHSLREFYPLHAVLNSQQRTQKSLCRFLEPFFCITFSSPLLCPVNSSWLNFPNLISLSLTQRDHHALISCSGSKTAFFRQKTRAHFICFLSLKDESPALPVVACQKTVALCNLPYFLIVYDGRVHLILLIPS